MRVMSEAQLEKKVADYLRDSQVLEDHWQRPITAEQLQAEMDRMAQQTKQPEVLRELFEALGNDPFVIAECLARPVLSERLITNFVHGNHTRFALESRRARAENQMHKVNRYGRVASYRLPSNIGSRRTDAPMILGQPPARPTHPLAETYHTAVWTGS